MLAAPLMSRHRVKLLRLYDRVEPQWIARSIAAYHAWFSQIQNRPAHTPVWQLTRPRLGQLAIEIIFVSGLLTFSDVLLNAVAKLEFMQQFQPQGMAYGFWSLVTVVLLVPLVAIWRNCSALSMLWAEGWASKNLPRGVLENVFKATVTLVMLGWIYLLLPPTPFEQWGWLIIVVGAAIIVAIFSGRLVFWHSQLHYSMREVLTDQEADRGELRAKARTSLGENLDRWNVVLFEATLPLNSALAGQSLAELTLPSRHGCAVIEIERNGHSIDAPTGGAVLYPGDKVLFVGPADRVETVRVLLEASNVSRHAAPDVTGMVLDTCEVSTALAGKTLRGLDLAARSGIRVVGIQRASDRIINPQAEAQLTFGDKILILGTLESLRLFHRNQAALSAPPASPMPPT